MIARWRHTHQIGKSYGRIDVPYYGVRPALTIDVRVS